MVLVNLLGHNRAAQSDIVTSKKIFYVLFLHVVVNTDVISCLSEQLHASMITKIYPIVLIIISNNCCNNIQGFSV